MNQLYATTDSRRLDVGQMQRLMGLIRSTSPQQAKEQVQRLIRERGVTQQERDETAARASEICRALGIR